MTWNYPPYWPWRDSILAEETKWKIIEPDCLACYDAGYINKARTGQDWMSISSQICKACMCENCCNRKKYCDCPIKNIDNEFGGPL